MTEASAAPRYEGRVLLNTLSSYVRLATNMVVGFVMVPVLNARLGKEGYGFWVLLWAIFGYLILMDFGFGLAVQRRAAALEDRDDLSELSETVSSIFVFSCTLSAVLLAVAVGVGLHIEHFVTLPSGDVGTFRTMFIVFACLVLLAFPFGIFREILWGVHRIALLNWLGSAASLVTFGFVLLFVRSPDQLVPLALIGAGLPLLVNLVETAIAFATFPKLRLSLRRFTVAAIRRTASFGIFAFLFTLASLVIHRTDQIVIGLFEPLAAVALYQFGFGIAAIIAQLNTQIQWVITPVVAEMHQRSETAKLHRTVAAATKFGLGITAPLALVLAVLSPDLIRLWVGERAPESSIVCVMLVGALLVDGASGLLARTLLMAGQERLLCAIVATEAVLNLALSLVLLRLFGIVGVAAGTLVAAAASAVAISIACRARLGLSLTAYTRRALLPVLAPLLPVAAILAAVRLAGVRQSIATILVEVAAALTAYVVCFYWLALEPDERDLVRARVRRLRRPKPLGVHVDAAR